VEVAYTEPLSRGWGRMKSILFSPFRLEKWFVLGFTAWLAYLTDWKGLGGNGGASARTRFDSVGDSVDYLGERAGEFFISGVATAFMALLVLGGIALFFLLLWLSSRGHFLFLDNVVHNRSRVSDPWKRFGKLGDSLFVWRVVYTLACIVAIGPLIGLFVVSALPFAVRSLPGEIGVAGLLFAGTVAVIFIVAAVYVDFFLLHFVAPIMYKQNVSAMEGWRRFLPVFREKYLEFLLYGLFYLLLVFGAMVVIVVFGLVTCCAGFFLLAIPYIGTVLLLPMHVTFRGMDLEFLAQFGPDLDLTVGFPETATNAAEG